MNNRSFWRGLLAAPLALLLSVSRGEAAPNSGVSRDIGKLSQLVSLPQRPIHVLWKSQAIGDGNFGPSDMRVTAVLVFAPRDLALIEQAASRVLARDGFVDVQTWFPSVIRQRAITESAGKFTRNLRLKARQLDAGAFYKVSLQNGALFHIRGTNYCVLSLFTT